MSAQLPDDYWTLENYLADLNKKWELSSVVYLGGQLCGFIIVSEKELSLHVNRIIVAKDMKQYGIGKLLIENAIKDVRRYGKQALTLKVAESNTGALSFYDKLNFVRTGSQGGLLLMELKVNA